MFALLVLGADGYDCRFSLPGFGKFALEVCVEMSEQVVCQRRFLGRTLEDWEAK